jgi:hypothetical protein
LSTSVEFKIKDETVKWEQNDPYITKVYDSTVLDDVAKLARKDAKEIANKLQKEIRWNYVGFKNGNYVRPDFKF